MDRSVKQPGAGLNDWKELILVGAGATVGATTYASLWLGEVLYGGPEQDLPINPISLACNLATGDVDWTGAANGGLATLLIGTGLGAVGARAAWRAGCRKCRALSRHWEKHKKEAIDAQAKYMGRGRELEGLSEAAVAERAAALNVQLNPGDAPGVMIGRSVADDKLLFASYEDLHLDIWGPRSGKTTTRVIPAVMEAPGAVVATSNKRDVVDATRRFRATKGPALVFDPQGVADGEPTFYWDPTAWVLGDGDPAAAQERAYKLAAHFAFGGPTENEKRDAFFDPEGEDLLAGLILAAALDKKPITQVFAWVTDDQDRTPVKILQRHHYDQDAAGLIAQYNCEDKQRSGIFGTAKKMSSCLKFRRIQPWVTPPQEGERPRESFDVNEFVKSKGTLYPLSKEGQGSAGPLVTALCAAIADAGAAEGTRHPNGRLPVPMTVVLDEAANIVRWKDLPKQYSHFGSRGIVVMTVLQSWAQGTRCWGTDGMEALWSASNIKVLGAGLDGAAFLRDRSELIGPHYELSTSVSRGKDSRSVSTSRTTETTLHASDIAAMPKGRIIVFSSGHRPTLAKAIPWWWRDYDREIREALAEITAPAARPQLRIVPPPADEEGKTA
ncbi:type IV secretory system conjugative DNA transfer family protein [Nocardia rhamnosiphila]